MKHYYKNYQVFRTTESRPDATELTEAQYNNLLDVIERGCPTPREGYGYRLTIDGEWEEYELPAPVPPPTDWELSDSEALNIITKGYETE